MRLKELYILKDGAVVDEDYRLAHIKLLKLLFRLSIINQSSALNVVMEFRPFFV